MTADQAITRRGGGYHEVIMIVLLAILLVLVVCLPAPSQAADVPAGRVQQAGPLRIGALPPPQESFHRGGAENAEKSLLMLLPQRSPRLCGESSLRLVSKTDIRSQEDPDQVEKPDQDDTTEAIVLTPDEYRRLKQPGHSLSPDEYKEFKNLTTISRATPLQVAAVNLAVKATGVLVIALAWLVFLEIFRRRWDRWFDPHIYDQTWPSVVVVCVLLACTAWILVSVVS